MDTPRPMMKEKNRLQDDIIKCYPLHAVWKHEEQTVYYLWIHMYLTIM